MNIKNLIRSTLNILHLDLTKNLEYDRLTKVIMRKTIQENTNCIDVGCHKGEIMDEILKYAPKGKHYGFEPIPFLYNQLQEEYNGKVNIYPYALSNENGESTFQFVKNAPAYSGIKKRKYAVEMPEVEEIKVELRILDEIIPETTKIGFIKIDVEGGEFNVLKGSQQLLTKDKPILIFETGLGASEYYGTKPEDLFDYMANTIGLKISLLKSFIKNKPSLKREEFIESYNTNKDYYFVAHP